MALEYTFTMAKKDCIERHLVGKVITRFEERAWLWDGDGEAALEKAW